jgi:hypothetical protein
MNPEERMNAVIDFYAPLVTDQLDRFRNDVYRTHTYAHDTTFKALNIHNHDLIQNWNNIPTLNEHPQCSKSLYDFYSPGIKVASESAYSHDEKEYDWQGKVTSNRKSLLMMTELQKVDIEVWGRADLEPGDVVYMNVGRLTQEDTSSHDPYYSGRYMISAIHHRLSPREYKMNLQLVKDSVINSMG